MDQAGDGEGLRRWKPRSNDGFSRRNVGYVLQSHPHYVENTGDVDLVFLEIFRTARYEDTSLAEWMAHTPPLLVDQHANLGTTMLEALPKQEAAITSV